MNDLEKICAVDFAKLYCDEKHQPPLLFFEKLRSVARMYDRGDPESLVLAGLFLESLRSGAAEQEIAPSALLGFALTPNGNWRVCRDYTAHFARYKKNGFERDLKQIQQTAGGAHTTTEMYEESVHRSYLVVMDVIERLQRPFFLRNALETYRCAVGEDVFKGEEIEQYVRQAEQLTPEQLRM